VKPETTKGLRRLLPRQKRTKRPGDRSEAGGALRPSAPQPAGLESDFDPVEFAEFLDADESPIPIDPGFKEQLRERLWSMVRERNESALHGSERPRDGRRGQREERHDGAARGAKAGNVAAPSSDPDRHRS
jgi:hypothetical protein